MENYIPDRGDIVWINMNPQAGHKQSGRRPAVVLSPRSYNAKVGLAIFCPITNRIKGYPFEVIIPDGLKVTGAILADHVKNLDWKARDAELIDRISDTVILDSCKKLATLLYIVN